MKSLFSKKVIAVLMVLLLASSLAAACGKNNANEGSKNNTGNPATNNGGSKNSNQSSGPANLTVWHPLNPNAQAVVQSLSDVAMVQEWEKKTNVKFKFEHPTGTNADAQQQFGVMVASGSYPDLIIWHMSNFQGGPAKLYQDGVIMKLNDLIDQHAPNLKKILDENPLIAKQIKADNGDIYVFPNLKIGDHGKYKTFSGQMIREDWLKELNLEAPETVDEWENVLRKIKEAKGIFPYTSEKGTLLGSSSSMDFIGAYGIGKDFYLEGKQVQYGPLQPSFKDYLARMQQWYKDGLIDPDYASNDNAAKEAKMTSGKAAATFGYIGGSIGSWLPAMQQSNPDAMLKGVQYPVLNKGDEPKFTETGWDYSNTGALLSSKIKNPEAAIKALDYLLSEEGSLLKNFGVEGTTYNMVDGQPVYTDLIMNNPDKLPVGQAMAKYFIANYPFPGVDDDRYNDQYYALDAQKDAVRVFAQYSHNAASVLLPPIALTPEEASEYGKIMTDINTYRDEVVTKIIMGTAKVESFDQALEQFKKMGIDRAIEIQQAAFDRFQNR